MVAEAMTSLANKLPSVLGAAASRSIKMVSDMDTTMMEVERLDRVGHRLMVTGVMMGNFPTEIYLEPADLLAMLALHLRPSPLSFLIGLPYFWLRSYWRRPENKGLGGRVRGIALSVTLAVAGLVAATTIALGLVEMARIAGGALPL